MKSEVAGAQSWQAATKSVFKSNELLWLVVQQVIDLSLKAVIQLL